MSTPVDAYVPSSPRDEFSLGAAVLAGVSLLGVFGSGCAPKPQASTPVAVEMLSAQEQTASIDIRASQAYELANSAQIEKATEWALEQNYKLTPRKPGESRHDLRERVQAQDMLSGLARNSKKAHYDGADIVVIAFEGTGAFHPRKASVMQSTASRLRAQGLRIGENEGSLAAKVSTGLTQEDGRDSGWSGLSRGPLEALVRSPELSSKTQWFSFPSEELEVFSRLDAYKDSSVGDIVRESYKSFQGETPGIEGALETVQEVLQQAESQGKNPKFVLVSHSSGGRSLVKFLEKAKALTGVDGKGLRFSSALTIDPVREAHETFFEAGHQLINKGTEHNLNHLRCRLGMEERKVWPPLVSSRVQPESLYAPGNTDEFHSFFQRGDSEGLKAGPEFGIHGSPVVGAENFEVPNLGTDGHGSIAVHPTVVNAFLKTIRQAR